MKSEKLKELRAEQHKWVKPALYAGIVVEDNCFFIAIKKGNKIDVHKTKSNDKEILQKILSYSKKDKIIAAGFTGIKKAEEFGSELWLKHDIVPYISEDIEGSGEQKAKQLCKEAADHFDKFHLPKVFFEGKRSVEPTFLVTLDDYKKTVDKKEFDLLLKIAERCKEKNLKIAFFNSTAAGGGVALMRHALIRLYQLLGVDVTWHVLQPKEEIFHITKKKFHNILQGVAPLNIMLTNKDIDLFKDWSKSNASFFEGVFKKIDVIIIDDPQPSGIIPYIKKVNSKAKIIYRSHIQLRADLINAKEPQQYITWDFVWQNIKLCNLFVSHPILEFIPEVVESEKTILMPATTDPLDGLNKPLDKEQMDYYLEQFNMILKGLGQKPLDPKRPYIIQIARFDPSKGIPHVLESYRKLNEKLKEKLPQLVIIGHGAVDDPEGAPIYSETMQMLKMDTYSHLADDIKVARLPHSDQILNALLTGSKIALQLSLREGFEVKVSESLHKGKPVIAYKTGGIPLQIKDGFSGYLVEPGDTDSVSQLLYGLLSDKKKYDVMSNNAENNVSHDYFTVNNAYKWLFLALELSEQGKLIGNCRNLNEIIKEKNL